ncbi:MAG: type I-E CRISPR-associated protein Cse1/CasA [Gemmatimonadota bacterium]|nr:type I-E CRISPR-associated protein Cse1/CasA [Gemmatimonadota bacterium]
MYDLRYEPWIPWRRRSGRVEWGPIRLLTDQYHTDPVVALAAPRPEFNGALTEFLIGLLTVAIQPEDEKEWKRLWDRPPAPAEIEEALGKLPDAFRLGGEGPRFMQDLMVGDFEDAEVLPVERLLFDAPGEQAVELNKDLFAKRNRAATMGPPAAAMALLAMQTYAPSGGKGYRTSMRGGGPLTTLVDPRQTQGDGDQLWRQLWANAETAELWGARGARAKGTAWPRVFPWLDRTRTSDPKQGGRPTTPADGNPLQAYFGMPRRIRLELGGAGGCSITGSASAFTVVGFRARNYGVEYDGWSHPLTPSYRPSAKVEWWPVHPQPAGIGWKDWGALTLEGADDTTKPARTVGQFHHRGPAVGIRAARLNAFGVDFDNMKCRGWVEARLPYLAVPDEVSRLRLRDMTRRLTEAASLTAAITRIQVKAALFDNPDEARGEFEVVIREVWSATETAFYAALERAAGVDGPEALEGEARAFHPTLRAAALTAFDRQCEGAGAPPNVMRRTVTARYRLSGFLNGYGPKGAQLAELLWLVVPAAGAKKGTGKRKGKRTT